MWKLYVELFWVRRKHCSVADIYANRISPMFYSLEIGQITWKKKSLFPQKQRERRNQQRLKNLAIKDRCEEGVFGTLHTNPLRHLQNATSFHQGKQKSFQNTYKYIHYVIWEEMFQEYSWMSIRAEYQRFKWSNHPKLRAAFIPWLVNDTATMASEVLILFWRSLWTL